MALYKPIVVEWKDSAKHWQDMFITWKHYVNPEYRGSGAKSYLGSVFWLGLRGVRDMEEIK